MGSLKEHFRPNPEFQEDSKEPLLDISLTDSKELWLIQWPISQDPDFDGQEVTLKLKDNGLLGSFESLSGKSYDVVSFASQEPDPTVFLPSRSDSKIVGKISRRVCLVHYPEPSELEKRNYTNSGRMRSAGASSTNSSQKHRYMTPRQGGKSRVSSSQMSYSALTPSFRSRKSSLFDSGEPSKLSKRMKTEESMRSADRITQESDGRGRSDVTFGSAGSSHQEKLKGKIKQEK